jgi:hypothetical protein
MHTQVFFFVINKHKHQDNIKMNLTRELLHLLHFMHNVSHLSSLQDCFVKVMKLNTANRFFTVWHLWCSEQWVWRMSSSEASNQHSSNINMEAACTTNRSVTLYQAHSVTSKGTVLLRHLLKIREAGFLKHILQHYGQTVWSQNTTAVPYPQWQQFLYFFQLANTLIQQGNTVLPRLNRYRQSYPYTKLGLCNADVWRNEGIAPQNLNLYIFGPLCP